MFIVLALVLVASSVFLKQAQAATYSITVNSGSSTGGIKYGGIGWLYGLGENNYIPDSKITNLGHPGYSGQKAPWGAQHAYGDALNVAVQAKRVGMKGIDIYVQDYYAQWPYPNNGIDSYIKNVLDKVIDSVKKDANRSFVRYDPFNEPDWIWYGSSGSKLTQFLNDWKKAYNEIKSRDGSAAKIIGPSFEHYSASAYDAFISFCKANNCLPDVITWHELGDDFFSQYYNNYNSYRSIESKYGIGTKEVYINEYGRSGKDIPRPGKLIQYRARFENTKVWGGMAFWTGGNKLDDLLTDEGAGNGRETGAYWLYQWYGHMSGNTVNVALPSSTGALQAIGSKSGTNTVKVIFGGSGGDSDVNTINVVVTGLSSGTVKYEIYETNYTTGYESQPGVRSSGTATVSNGQITISVSNAKALSAYLVNVHP